MALQNFDKLNTYNRRAIPYSEYFGDMELTEKQKARRINLAILLEDIIAIWFIYYANNVIDGTDDEVRDKQQLTYMIYDAISDNEYFPNEEEKQRYITNLVNEIYKSTKDNVDDYLHEIAEDDEEEPSEKENNKSYWVSEDRAKFIAENEANTICNNAEYVEALEEGMTHKIWVTYLDNRVRPTHLVMSGAEVPIDVYYDVGDAHMLFPKDVASKYSTGAIHPEEIVNCRCSIKYIKK